MTNCIVCDGLLKGCMIKAHTFHRHEVEGLECIECGRTYLAHPPTRADGGASSLYIQPPDTGHQVPQRPLMK